MSVASSLARTSPSFFVNVASKGLRVSVSLLESVVAEISASVDCKGLTGKHNSWTTLSALSRKPIPSRVCSLFRSRAGSGRRTSPSATFSVARN
jgi:hypothetical protein